MRRRSELSGLVALLAGCATIPPTVQDQLARELSERAGAAIQAEMIGDTAGLAADTLGPGREAMGGGEDPASSGGDSAADGVLQGSGRSIDAAIRCASEGVVCTDDGVEPVEEVDPTYDFEPGERILFELDVAAAAAGGLPRGVELRGGGWDVVEREGRRWLRNSGPRSAALTIPLPEDLPESFTIEFDLWLAHGNQRLVVATSTPAAEGFMSLPGNAFQIGADGDRTGIIAPGGGEHARLLRTSPEVAEAPTPIGIMVDGSRASVYAGDRAVARVENGTFERGAAIYLENAYFATESAPLLIGPIRIAARDDRGGGGSP